jgi:hypothetical protein
MRLWDDNTYNTQERAGIINSLGHTPKPDGAMEGDRLPRGIMRLLVWGTAQGALGDRDGPITLSTQRATRSLLVVVLPPAAFALLLILCFWASSIVF